MTIAIQVFADWNEPGPPRKLGLLHAQAAGQGGREVFSFEFEPAALQAPRLTNILLDPRLQAFEGPQYAPDGAQFGLFSDASPDRWGRMLMRRRLERAKRTGTAPANSRLTESDFLLGVHDTFRVGALRYRLADDGPFLDHQDDVAAPPFIRLRELEEASRALDNDDTDAAEDIDAWLRLLVAPGGSLGGARPKASVVDQDGYLWIAKFPSSRDEMDIGAWEMVVQTLARGCGIQVPDAQANCYASEHHTFLIQRFDRTAGHGRVHFASAMTLTDHQDGDDATRGVSYIEIAKVIIQHGANAKADLQELWSRIVFNMLVSNTDDHLRNHGFLLVPGKGWVLSPAYDMNPNPDGQGLKLNVSEADNALDLDLALSVAPQFRLKRADAESRLANMRKVVAQWPKLAAALGISRREQDSMSTAFKLAE